MGSGYIANQGDFRINGVGYKNVVRTVARSNNPQWRVNETKTLGTTLTHYAAPEGGEQWNVTLVDDYSDDGAAGALYKLLYDAYKNGTNLTNVASRPAGSTPGMIETKFTAPVRVISVAEPEANADAENPVEVVAVIHTPSSTKAAIL